MSLARSPARFRILYISGYTYDELAGRGINAEIGEFVRKSFNPQQLLQTFARHVTMLHGAAAQAVKRVLFATRWR